MTSDAPGQDKTFRITRALSSRDFSIGRSLILEYAHHLEIDLGFQDFASELEHLAGRYGEPVGTLLIGWADARAVGCVALRRHRERTAEMKRLYVKRGYRARGLARLPATECIRSAKTLGYREIVLDTLSSMDAARHLYESLGFRTIRPYYENPVDGARHLGLRIA